MIINNWVVSYSRDFVVFEEIDFVLFLFFIVFNVVIMDIWWVNFEMILILNLLIFKFNIDNCV